MRNTTCNGKSTNDRGRNTAGHIKRIITGHIRRLRTGVKVTVTVKQKLNTLISLPFEELGRFKHCF